MKMKVANHEPMIRPNGTLTFRGWKRSVDIGLAIFFLTLLLKFAIGFSSTWQYWHRSL